MVSAKYTLLFHQFGFFKVNAERALDHSDEFFCLSSFATLALHSLACVTLSTIKQKTIEISIRLILVNSCFKENLLLCGNYMGKLPRDPVKYKRCRGYETTLSSMKCALPVVKLRKIQLFTSVCCLFLPRPRNGCHSSCDSRNHRHSQF